MIHGTSAKLVPRSKSKIEELGSKQRHITQYEPYQRANHDQVSHKRGAECCLLLLDSDSGLQHIAYSLLIWTTVTDITLQGYVCSICSQVSFANANLSRGLRHNQFKQFIFMNVGY